MKLSKTKISVSCLTLLTIVMISGLIIPAGAQVSEQYLPDITTPAPRTVGQTVNILAAVVRWVYIIFFIIAVLFILFAAFTYLTAGGEAEKVTKAKNQLIYAVIAIVVALLAVGFEAIIRNFLAAPTV